MGEFTMPSPWDEFVPDPEDHIKRLTFVKNMIWKAIYRISQTGISEPPLFAGTSKAKRRMIRKLWNKRRSKTSRIFIRDNEQLNVYYQIIDGEQRYWTGPMPGLNVVLTELEICSEWSEAGRSCEEIIFEFLREVCMSRDYLQKYYKQSKKEGISKAALQGSLLGCQHVIDLLEEVGYPCPSQDLN